MNTREKLRQAIRSDRTLQKSISDQVTLENHAGEGDLKTLQLSKIQLNPNNPRKLNISLEEITEIVKKAKQAEFVQASDTRVDFTNPTFTSALLSLIKEYKDEDKASKLEKLFFLAKSIHEQSLIQPIAVSIDDEGQYNILAGERRYLAHIFLERETIRTMVRQKSHDNLKDRTASLVENIIREDLSTAEKIDYIEELIQLYEERHTTSITFTTLSGLINESERTCRRYLRFLGASEIIRSKIRKGELKTIREIEDAIKKESEKKLELREEPVQLAINNKIDRQGRKRLAITLGKTQNIELVKVLTEALQQICQSQDQKEVDWDDLESVQNFWNKLIQEADFTR